MCVCVRVRVRVRVVFYVWDAKLKVYITTARVVECVCDVCTQAQDFRRGALAVCEEAVTGRASSDTVAMRYYYPPNLLDYQPRVDPNDSEITVSVDYLTSDGTRCSTNIQAQNVIA